jgi:YVTN family beta-propeller protein
MKTNKIIVSILLSTAFAGIFSSCDSKKTDPVIETIKTPSSPRALAAANGKVYISLYDGHVAQLDTVTMTVEKSVTVGSNPEGIAFANNKIYVANSGGMAAKNDSTISVIDPVTFKVIKTIKVVINPTVIKADTYGDIYVISNGNYSTIPYTLQRIDAITDVVTTIPNVHPINMTIEGDNAYLYSYDYDSNYKVVNKAFIQYDVKNEKPLSSSFITASLVVKTPYSIDVNPITKDIYIGESDFVNSGKMNCFGADGVSKFNFATGINPSKTVFVNSGAFVLNQGAFKGNNAGITYYNLMSSTTTSDYFTSKNNRGLGDSGQDMIKYGSKIYVAVYSSSLIEVINAATGVSAKTIIMETVTNK